MQKGTLDFKTGCEKLMLPAPALFPAFNCTAVFPAEPGEFQTSSKMWLEQRDPRHTLEDAAQQ